MISCVYEACSRVSTLMFSLVEGVLESLTPVGRESTIVFLGLDGAGKSAMIQNLKLLSQKQEPGSKFEKLNPTLGLSVSKLAGPSRATLLEIGGSPSIRPMWRHYYADANKFVFVLDSSNIHRYDEAYKEFSDFIGVHFPFSQSLAFLISGSPCERNVRINMYYPVDL